MWRGVPPTQHISPEQRAAVASVCTTRPKGAHPNGRDHTLCAHKQPARSTRAHSPVRFGAPIPKTSSPLQLLPARSISRAHVNSAILPPPFASAARHSQSHRRRPKPEVNRPPSRELRRRCHCRVLCQRSRSPQTPREASEPHAPCLRRRGPRRLRRCSRGQILSTRTHPHPRPRLMVHPSSGWKPCFLRSTLRFPAG